MVIIKGIKSSIPVSFLALDLVVTVKIPADNAFDLWIFLITHEVYSLIYRLDDQDCIKLGVVCPLFYL